MKVLVLAGGKGTRLWPLSRKYKPKQFQKLFSDKTMLQETVSRVLPSVSFKDIFVATNEQYVEEVKRELPDLPRENIIAEPSYRERVAAFLLFFCYLKEKELKEPVLILPSDHLIREEKRFQEVVVAGARMVSDSPESLLLLGESPIFPDTGLGYIKKGKYIKKENEIEFYEVDTFKEKPDVKKAQKFLKSKDYLWNAGIFVFCPELVIKLTKKFVPDNYKRYRNIRKAFGSKNFEKILKEEFLEMDKVSFDVSITENYDKNIVIPTSLGWSDIGSWAVLKDCLASSSENYIKGNYIGIDSSNIMVYGTNEKLVTSLGVKDLIIAVTDEVIFVCNKNDSQRVKELIEKLKNEGKIDYL